jgi:hypothetical protein
MIYMHSLILPGTSRCACGLQKISEDKNCDIWDWHWFEWRFPCHSWDGWVWGSVLWNRWRWRAGGEPFEVVILGKNPQYLLVGRSLFNETSLERKRLDSAELGLLGFEC